MSKQEYLDLLKYYLKDFPDNVVKDIIFDYDEHFNIGLENAKSEDQISKELGSPEIIARQYLENEGRGITRRRDKGKNLKFSTIAIGIGIFILLSPLILPLLGILVGLIAAFIGAIIGIIGLSIGAFVFGVALLLSFVPGVTSLGFISMPALFVDLHPITVIFASVASISASILMVSLGINFFKWLFKSMKNLFISIKWKIEKRGDKDEE